MGKEQMRNGQLKKIFVVPHSHHDYAWVHERAWHLLRYTRLLHDATEWMEKNPDARWMIDNVIHSWVPFEKNDPETAKKFAQFVKEGRAEVSNGGYSLARPSYVGEETFVRNLVAGDEYFRKTFGEDVPIELYNNFDVSAGQTQLPQLIRLAGMKYYHFYRPELTLDHKRVPRSFYWKGLDGTTVLVHRGFCPGLMSGGYMKMDFETQWEDMMTFFYNEDVGHRRPEGVFFPDIEFLPLGVDDSLPPYNRGPEENPIPMDEFMAEFNRREPCEMVYATAHDFFKELETKEIPVYDGHLDDSELTYNLPSRGDNSMWRRRVELDRRLLDLEAVCTINALMGRVYPEEEIRRFWYQLFEITGHAIEFIHERDDANLMQIANNALTGAGMLLEKALDEITRGIAYRKGMLHVSVNPLPIEREEVVKVYVTTDAMNMPGFRLVDVNGNELPYQVVEDNCFGELFDASELKTTSHNSLDVLVRLRVPALGYTAVFMEPNGESSPIKAVHETMVPPLVSKLPQAPDGLVIDNGVLRVSLTNGSIDYIENIRTGKKAVAEEGRPLMRWRMVRTPEYEDWLTDMSTQEELMLEYRSARLLEKGPYRWRYRVCGTFTDGQNVTYDLVMEKDEPAIKVELVLDTRPTDCYYIVDFRADEGCKTYGNVYYGVEERRAEDVVIMNIEAMLPGQLYARDFMTFETGKMPAAIVSNDCSVYYFHDLEQKYMSLFLVRNCVMENAKYEWIRDMAKDYAMNGENHFNFALYFGEETGRFSDVQDFTRRYQHPIYNVTKFDRVTEGAPAEQELLKVEGAVPTAVYMKDGAVVVRSFETEGENGKLSVTVPSGRSTVQSVDLLGHPFDTAAWTVGKTAETDLRPFEIVTCEIR